jgi:glycosyltransferase involved in cell wall biosynthesis
LKIAVNTRLLLKNKLEGIGRFSYEVLKIITKDHPECQFYFIFDRPYSKEFVFSDNVTPIVAGPPARHPFLFYLWFEFTVARILKKIKPDVFVSPDGYISLSTGVKTLSVMHDLNFHYYPNDLPFLMSRYYNYFFPKFAIKATRIATVSQFSAMDIANTFKINPNKIDVVFNGASGFFTPSSKESQDEYKIAFTDKKTYFLYVGSMHPRKNIINLLMAFDHFKNASSSEVKLLLVGEKYYWTNEMETTFEKMEHQKDVMFTGRLSDEQLKNVISAALALVYVSYFEGFGLPVLEAMYCDIPVITSNVTSMPEVAGNAALLTDPFSPESISDAMLSIYEDEGLRQDLISKGRIQREKFSWQITADKMWESIIKTHNA